MKNMLCHNAMDDKEIKKAICRNARPGIAPIVEKMKFEAVTDCWCGGLLAGWLPEFELYYQCVECGCKSVRFRPTTESLEMFYAEHYWYQYQTIHDCPSIPERYENDILDRVPTYLRWIEQLRLPPARMLEVGCGNGRLLHELAMKGYECYGCELDPDVADWVRKKTGITVYEDPFPENSKGNYDLILIIDVLEHVPQQLRFVQETRSRLNQEGKILIHCPVIDSAEVAFALKHLFNPVSHLWMHTTRSLSKLWASVGLQPTRLGLLFDMPCFAIEE